MSDAVKRVEEFLKDHKRHHPNIDVIDWFDDGENDGSGTILFVKDIREILDRGKIDKAEIARLS